MIFRAKIVDVKPNSSSRKVVSEDLESNPLGLYEYKIRIPLMHGTEAATEDDALPYAMYVPYPGTKNTKLGNGTLVYVASVDLELDEYVILGIIPTKDESSSQSSIEDVSKLSTSKKSTIDILCDTLNLWTEDNQTAGTAVNKKNFKALVDWEEGKLSEYTWPVSNGGTGVSVSSTDTDQLKYEKGKDFCDNLGLTKIRVISVSDFDELTSKNLLEDNTLYFTYNSTTDLE